MRQCRALPAAPGFLPPTCILATVPSSWSDAKLALLKPPPSCGPWADEFGAVSVASLRSEAASGLGGCGSLPGSKGLRSGSWWLTTAHAGCRSAEQRLCAPQTGSFPHRAARSLRKGQTPHPAHLRLGKNRVAGDAAQLEVVLLEVSSRLGEASLIQRVVDIVADQGVGLGCGKRGALLRCGVDGAGMLGLRVFGASGAGQRHGACCGQEPRASGRRHGSGRVSGLVVCPTLLPPLLTRGKTGSARLPPGWPNPMRRASRTGWPSRQTSRP